MGEAAPVLDDVRPTDLLARDLTIPDPTRFSAVMSSLSEPGQAHFISEIMEALKQAKRWDSLQPVQSVIDAWWHTFHFGSHLRIKECIAEAAMALERSDERLYTAEEVAVYIGL